MNVGLLQTCNEMIFAIIKELIQQESEELHTARTKIVVISHDISFPEIFYFVKYFSTNNPGCS